MTHDDIRVVGDTPYDAEAAAKAGLGWIELVCGGFPETDLIAAGCVAIDRDLPDLNNRFAQPPLAGR